MLSDILGRILQNRATEGAVKLGLFHAQTYRKKKDQDVECEVTKRGHAHIFLGVGIVFALLIAFGFSVPNNLNESNKGIVLTFCFSSLALTFIPGILFWRWFLRIKGNTLSCRRMLGRTQSIPLSQLTGFKVGEDQELILYKDGKKFFVISGAAGQGDVLLALDRHDVPYMKPESPWFTMRISKGHLLALVIMAVIGVGIVGATAILSNYIPLWVITLAMLATTGLYIYRVSAERITVTDSCIKRTIPWKKPIEIPFDQVQKVELVQENNSQYYCIYVNKLEVLKILEVYSNTNRFYNLALQERWIKKSSHSKIRHW